jgi:GNAT superfamily N-acetyltransferase
MIRELGPGETTLASLALMELRPHIASVQHLVQLINRVQRGEGYRLVAAFSDDDPEQAVAAAGFRVAHHLAWGRALYCDDLVTRVGHRRRGHASGLLAWLLDEAVRSGCDQLHLDSGTGPDRADAHRLYLNSGMRISSHHFQRNL